MFAVYPNDSVYNKYFKTYTSGLRNENIGTQRIIGLEVSFYAKISKFILLNTYYTYTNGISIKNSTVKEQLPRVATNKIWVSLEFLNLFKIIDLSTRFRWTDEYYNYNKLISQTTNNPDLHVLTQI
jgi:outer membrane receptor for ferrienterochelin and colicin